MAGFSPSPTTNDQHDHQHPADLPRSSGNGSVTLRFPTLRGAMQDENGDGQQDHGGIEANSESRSNQKGAPTTTNYNLNAKPSPGGGDDSATTSLLSAASGDHPRPQTPKELAHDDAKVIVAPTILIAPPSATKHKAPPISINTDSSPIITSYIPLSRTSSPQTSISRSKPDTPALPPPHPAMPSSISKTSNMFFSSAHRRRNMANTNALTTYEADLNNKDRAKQKEAVRRFLEENIEEDWHFQWPQSTGKTGSIGFVDELGNTGRQAQRWKERDEWLSNTNDSDDDPAMPTTASPDTATPTSEHGGFKFESPDDVGDAVKKRELERKQRRERKLQAELEVNPGLRCFVARRDVWTGARKVKRNSVTTRSSKTLTEATASPPSNSQDAVRSQNGTDVEDSATDNHTNGYDIDSSASSFEDEATEIPVAPPLLPPTNPMRASISPAAYPVIYDKVVLQNLAPSCPVNLQDIINSCVQGWKRDGEWPPKGGAPEASIRVQRKKARKLSVASILGLGRVISGDKKEGAIGEANGAVGSGESGIRKGLSKIFGKGKDGSGSGTGQVVAG